MAKPRGRPFDPGNTAGRGRPLGSRNQTTMMLESMLAEYAPAVVRKCLARALEGEKTAMRLVIERLLPLTRDTRVHLRLPKIKCSADLAKARDVVLKHMAAGEIGVETANEVFAILESYSRMLEAELESRVRSLEQSQSTDGNLEKLHTTPEPPADE